MFDFASMRCAQWRDKERRLPSAGIELQTALWQFPLLVRRPF
jgi:hypothetical protein